MRFINDKKNSHIWSNQQGKIVGRFSDGVFDTKDKELVKELKKRYKHTAEVAKIEIEEPVTEDDEDESLPEKEIDVVAQAEAEGFDHNMKRALSVDETDELKRPSAEVEELTAMKMPELVELAKEKGIYKFGMKKSALIQEIVKQ